MFKKTIAALGVAAGLAVLAPTAASADTGYQQITLQPGQRYCAQDYTLAYSQARGEGWVVSGHNVRLTFGTWSPSSQRLYDTGGPVTSFAAEAYSYLTPYAFPGRFETCAINQSLKVSNVVVRASGF